MYVLGYIMEISTVILKVFKQIGFKHGSTAEKEWQVGVEHFSC